MKKRKRPIMKAMLETTTNFPKHLDDQRIDYKEVNKGVMNKQRHSNVTFDTVLFKDCTIVHSVFVNTDFIDCIFMNCDFSNNRLEHTNFTRCEFKHSKLVGTSITDSSISHTLIDTCQSKFLDLANDILDVLEIKHSVLDASNWFETKIKRMVLDHVSLLKSQVYSTPFKGVDFSSSYIEGMRIDLRDIKGATIDPSQAVLLCPLIGVLVKDL